jgi:hypothetical protein
MMMEPNRKNAPLTTADFAQPTASEVSRRENSDTPTSLDPAANADFEAQGGAGSTLNSDAAARRGEDTPVIGTSGAQSGPILVRDGQRTTLESGDIDNGNIETGNMGSRSRWTEDDGLRSDSTDRAGSREWDVNSASPGPIDRRSSSLRDNSRDESRSVDANVTPLLPETEIGDLRARWNNIQAEFVDQPRRSVEQADQLVAAAMQRLAEGFANERTSLEKQWDNGGNVSTEDLRIALQRYRAFFGRLLNAA